MDTFPNLETKYYQDIRKDLQTGDILLCSGNSLFSELIKKTTKSVWSHVAFILRMDAIDRILVLESVESIGVRSIALSSYVRDYNATGIGYDGTVMIARHADMHDSRIGHLSRQAIDYLGYPYGKDEIIRIAARLSLHSLGLFEKKEEPHGLKEFICSEYAYVCYQSIGIHFPMNTYGFIAPADFAHHPKVKPLFYLHQEKISESNAAIHASHAPQQVA